MQARPKVPSTHLLYKGDLFLTSRLNLLMFPKSCEESHFEDWLLISEDFQRGQDGSKKNKERLKLGHEILKILIKSFHWKEDL